MDPEARPSKEALLCNIVAKAKNVLHCVCDMHFLPQEFPSTSSRRLAVELAVPNLERSLVKNTISPALQATETIMEADPWLMMYVSSRTPEH